MRESNNDEIDLGYLIGKFNQVLKNAAISLYKLVSFIIRNWIIILALVVLGVLLGYYSEKNKKPEQEATILLRPNFDTTHFAYEAIDLLNKKALFRDSIFLVKHGFRGDIREVLEITIEPVVDLNNIARKYNSNDRNLETLIENVEFEDGETLRGAFLSHYEFHLVTVTFSSDAKDGVIEKIMNYLNSTSLIKEVGSIGKQGLIDRIDYNIQTISQIDTVISRYHQMKPSHLSNSPSYAVGNELNMSEVLEVKNNLQRTIEILRKDVALSQETIVMLNEPLLVAKDRWLFGNKKMIYPILFVFAFLFLAWLRRSYFYVKKLAEDV